MKNIYNDQDESHARRSRALFIVAFVYQKKLNDLEEAKRLYEFFLKTYPGHPLEKMIQAQIDEINSLA